MYKERYPLTTGNISENLLLIESGKISFDIDAVAQGTFVKALNNASHIFKKVIFKSDLKTYWELDKIARANGIAESDSMRFTKSLWNTHDTYADSPKVYGFDSMLRMVNEISKSEDLNYYFISSRPPEFLETTQNWFLQKYPFVNTENIKLGRPKGMSGGIYKSMMINQFDIGLHFEDVVDEALEIVKYTNCKVIIVPQPWNINELTESPRIKRLDTYSYFSGVWPVLRFLSSPQARQFLSG
ncbi:MAG TPA: hypothetical protein VI819_00795 [Patescibacteria group bacterium]|nr:hypothetical protein [Patescibacteria group bacterium]